MGILFFILILLAAPLAARDIFPLAEVEKGLLGVGKTVFSGQKVETFEVEVLGIVQHHPPVDQLILIRVQGERIEEGGGIAAGMSGSPVYVDDKIMGAIGYGWTLTDHRLGLVTPIESMLTLWEEESDLLLFEDYYDLDELQMDLEGWAEELLDVKWVKTPLIVSGVGRRGFDILKEELSGYQLYSSLGGGLDPEAQEGELIPGSAIAIQLARGDVNVSAIGTLTHREENRVLGLGHPFLFTGGGGYLLSGAYIHSFIDSLDMPFKLGSPTQLQGTILKDRTAGVAGELYRYPSVVPLRITVLDKDRDQILRTNVQLVREEEFLLPLTMVSSLEAIDRAVDRIGRGTAEIRIELTAHGLPGKVLMRENVYNSQMDIASVAIMELGQIMSLLTFNPFKDVEFIDIKVDAEVTRELLMATIKEIHVLNETVYPGDELEIQVTLQPYRQEEEEMLITVQLPETVNTGTATLSIMSGFEAGYEQKQYEEFEEISGHAITSDYKNLEEMLQTFLDQPMNNELLVEIWPQYRGSVMEEEGEAAEELNNERIWDLQKTPYFLAGKLSTTLVIVPVPEEESSEEAVEVLY